MSTALRRGGSGGHRQLSAALTGDGQVSATPPTLRRGGRPVRRRGWYFTLEACRLTVRVATGMQAREPAGIKWFKPYESRGGCLGTHRVEAP